MKRILYVTPQTPFSTENGTEQRTNLSFNAFLDMGFAVDIANIESKSPPLSNLPPNTKIVLWDNHQNIKMSIFNKIKKKLLFSIYPKNSHISRKLQNIIESNKYDFIYCRYLQTACTGGLAKYVSKILLDIDDFPNPYHFIDFTKFKGLKKLYYKNYHSRFRKKINWWINHVKTCYVPDFNVANKYNIIHLPNISTIKTEDEISWENRFTILFIGLLSWGPNKAGLDYFIKNCWPEIKRNVPKATLYIGGKGLPESLKNEWTNNDINILGYVEDIEKFYSSGNLVICPIYSCEGTNIKIIEGMSMNKVVVLPVESSSGFADLLRDGENCIIAHNDMEMINKTIDILNHFDKQKEISHNAKLYTRERYSYENLKNILMNSL